MSRHRFARVLRATPGLRDIHDAAFLMHAHRQRMGRWPNPVRPRSFNEHVLRRMILERDPLFRCLNDKLAMRDFVAARLGPDHCVPLLGVHADPAEIDWDALPRAIVLKPSHASGLVRPLSDHTAVDRSAILAEARAWLDDCYYERSREWGYRGLPRRVLVEPMLPPPPGEAAPADCKLFVFDGRIALSCLRHRGRDDTFTKDLFDGSWRRLAATHAGRPPGGHDAPPPGVQDSLTRIAAALGTGHDMLRIDTYVVEDRVLIGEITVYPDAGRNAWEPHAWDLWLGAVWRATRRGAAWPPAPG